MEWLSHFFDLDQPPTAYKDQDDYLEDWKHFIDISIYLLCTLQKDLSQHTYLFRPPGLVMSSLEGETFFDLTKLSPKSIPRQYHLSLKLVLSFIEQRIHLTRETNIYIPLEKIADELLLNSYDRIILLVTLMPDLDIKYNMLYATLAIDINQPRASYGLLKNILYLYDASYQFTFPLDNPYSPFKSWFFEYTSKVHHDSLLAQSTLPRLRLLRYLEGISQLDDYLLPFCRIVSTDHLEPLYLYVEAKNRLVQQFLQTSQSKLINIYAPMQSGKSFLMQHVGHALDMPLLFVKSSGLLALSDSDLHLAIAHICSEVFFSNALICLEEGDLLFSADKGEKILDYFKEYVTTLFILSESSISYVMNKNNFTLYGYALEPPTLENKISIWQYLLKRTGLSNDVNFEFFYHFELPIGAIATACKTAMLHAQETSRLVITTSHILAAIKNMRVASFNHAATQINSLYTWDDLVIDNGQLELLKYCCKLYQNRYKVEIEWEFGKKNSYGKGITLLFYGQPGTGKTMAAQVIANELKLDIYRVDLSQMVSKYIGETEKNLDVIFTEAQRVNAILVFDEADALFGKRTDVNQSNDKHANMQVSYLLQRIEMFDGITILTTNLLHHFDEAFRRRITLSIYFQLPPVGTRLTIWNHYLSSSSTLKADVDIDFLAAHFELSPSAIKSIVRNSAYYTAYLNESMITMKHIIFALKLEYAKSNKLLLQSDLGLYSDLLDM